MNEERKILILYATQTGCSQEVAERIARESKKYWLKARVLSIDSYNLVRKLIFI